MLNRIKVSPHFNLGEFQCRGRNCCGGAVKVDSELQGQKGTVLACLPVSVLPSPFSSLEHCGAAAFAHAIPGSLHAGASEAA